MLNPPDFGVGSQLPSLSLPGDCDLTTAHHVHLVHTHYCCEKEISRLVPKVF